MNSQVALGEHDHVGRLMSRPVNFLPDDTTVLDALSVARELRIHHLPVGRADEPLGVLCTCDLREVSLSEKLGNLLARPYVSITVDATVLDAANLMRTKLVGSLLVADGDTIAGIITRSDVVRSLDGRTHLADVVCICCGSDQHLRADDYEQLLCVDCHERARDPHSFEQGLGG